MTLLHFAAVFLAGLGLFFQGLEGIKHSLQSLASRRVRRQLARWSKHSLLAAAWGFCLGALTQSVTAVAFILAGLVSGGLLPVARALPIVACANLGTAVLVLFASFDVHLAVLYVLGANGLALVFHRGERLRPLLSTLFFTALLFFGLRLMRDAFGPMPQTEWFQQAGQWLRGSLLAAFVAGALFRLCIQSSSAIALIAITLAGAGLLESRQAVAMIFGTGLGVAGAVGFLATSLQGVPRQIAWFQLLLSGTSSLLLGALLALEQLTHWPLLLAGFAQLQGNASLRMAYAFLALQTLSLLLALLGTRAVLPLLARLAPPTAEQELGRPRYLTDPSRLDPATALLLADQELLRIMERFGPAVDPAAAAAPRVSNSELHGANHALLGETHACLRELTAARLDPADSHRLLALERRHDALQALNDSLRDWGATQARLRSRAELGTFLDHLAESLTTLLYTASEAWRQGDATDRETLRLLTDDRGELMERLRRQVLGASPALPQEERTQLFYLTTLFERMVWLLRQLALSLASTTEALDPPSGTP